MKDTEREETAQRKADPQPYRLRLPGFIRDEEIRVRDVIKRATSAIGVRPCSGCEARAAALNHGWLSPVAFIVRGISHDQE